MFVLTYHWASFRPVALFPVSSRFHGCMCPKPAGMNEEGYPHLQKSEAARSTSLGRFFFFQTTQLTSSSGWPADSASFGRGLEPFPLPKISNGGWPVLRPMDFGKMRINHGSAVK